MINPHAVLPVLERQVRLYRKAREEAGRPAAEELPIIKELYLAPDRRTALAECRPYLEAKYQAYGAWGQDRALPAGDSFDRAFEELARDRFVIGDPDDCVRELRRHVDLLGVTCFIFRVQWPGMPQKLVLDQIELLGQ